jgi:hypothetical protein
MKEIKNITLEEILVAYKINKISIQEAIYLLAKDFKIK